MSTVSLVSNMSRRLRMGLVAFLAFVGLTVTTVVAAPAPAEASATWCRYTSTITLPGGFTVPTGNYCFSVIGSGTWVDFTSGSWNGPVIQNAGERVTFYDRYGNNKGSWITYSQPGNSYGYRYWRSGLRGNAWAGGSVCGDMMASGVTIGRICHRIA